MDPYLALANYIMVPSMRCIRMALFIDWSLSEEGQAMLLVLAASAPQSHQQDFPSWRRRSRLSRTPNFWPMLGKGREFRQIFLAGR
jgi:hypothetical protein